MNSKSSETGRVQIYNKSSDTDRAPIYYKSNDIDRGFLSITSQVKQAEGRYL